jgi:chromosome partitioning protein
MIIVCGGIKGGSGKTTIATNLAVMRSHNLRDVLLVDADDQETAADFTRLRSEKLGGASYTCIRLSGAAVRTETLKLQRNYADIVIDTGGRDTTSQRAALSVADLLLVPFVPRSFDVWTIEKIAPLVDEMRQANPNLQAWTFINRADSRGSDNQGAAKFLREVQSLQFVDTALGSRKAFSNASAEGLAVVELKPEDAKAIEEMESFYDQVFANKLAKRKGTAA